MSKIVIQAIPFCYGPASAAIRLARGLARNGHDVRFLADGTVAELARLSGVAFEELSPRAVNEAAAWAEIFCAVCDPPAYAAWPGSCRRVYVDFLYFMPCPAVPPLEAEADLYLIERYPGVPEAMARRSWHPRNPLAIAPLIEPPARPPQPAKPAQPGARALLTFGGTESPMTQVGVNTDYPLRMLSFVGRALARQLPEARLSVATSAAACAAIHRSGSTVECRSLGHQDFLRAIEESDVVITHPGLYTVFEAVRRERPVVLLPPSNYTQVLQLRQYVRLGLVPPGVEWHHLLPGEPGRISLDLEEAAGVREVLRAIATFAGTDAAGPALDSALGRQLDAFRSNAPEALAHQAASLSPFAGDGLPEALAAIGELSL